MSEGANERRIRIDLAYDGTDFAGWQFQPGQRTVQGTLEGVLRRLHGGRTVRVRGAGRTDSGVHARAQVADAQVETRLDDDGLAHALRGMLPGDVRPLGVRTVAPEFNARRAARSKTYRYRLDLTRHGDPFCARFALHHPDRLDDAAIDGALGQLPGRRDWSGFAASGCTVDNRVRTLTQAIFERSGRDEATFAFTADGFLQYMVRNLVGTLLEIGRARMPIEQLERILQSGDRALGGPTASAHGLCLEQVTY